MREIKFRAWDKEKGEFFKPTYKAHEGNLEYLQLSMDGRVHRVVLDEWDSLEVEDESLFENRYVIMQYTGLKDTNGVGIYEGDIVEYHDTSIKSDVISLVSWSAPMFVVDSGLLYFKSKEANKVFDGRIIGNVYENPELLGDRQ